MEILRGTGIFLSAEVGWGEGRMEVWRNSECNCNICEPVNEWQNQRERRGQSGSLERCR